MITISLCMIVKNEEDCLARCLNSVKDIADEIIIVDTGSTDKTMKIAKKFTNNIYEFEWINDFSAARNFAFSKATMDYRMWLDADDVILEADRKKILELKKTLSKDVDIVTMKYNTSTDADGNVLFSSTRGRLFKREKNHEWLDPIHEYIPLSGNVLYLQDIFITHKKEKHFTDRNIKIYEEQIKNNIELSPRSTYYYARELRDHGRHIEAIHYFEKFLNDGFGWVEDNIASCFALSVCYQVIKNQDKRLGSLLRSFEYAKPRAEICCQLGYYFRDEKSNLDMAVYWFKTALELENPNSVGFVLHDFWGYIPNIELAVCYYRLGDMEKSKLYNSEAKKHKPNSTAVKYNEDLFKEMAKKDLASS